MPKTNYPNDITTRSLALRLDAGGIPATLDEKNRSVEVLCATEMPVQVVDWERWEIVDEVLLMSGCQFSAETRQIPLLNTHKRGDISQVLGSCRSLEIVDNQLVGRAHYSKADDLSEQAYQKTREGHLTDYSVGYKIDEVFYVPEGEKQIIDERTFEGPIRVVTKWKVRELSTCPIGADELAKARAAAAPDNPNTEVRPMPDKKKVSVEESGRGVEEQTTVQTETPAATLTADDVQRQAQQIASAEIDRREEIRSMCNHYGFADMARELIDKNTTLDSARKAVMAKHMSEAQTTGGAGFRTVPIADERDKFRAAGEGSLILRAGLQHDPAKLAVGAADLRGYSLRELAREALRVAGQPINGNPMEMVGRALTTSDFPVLLGNTANISLMAGWDAAEETWEQWADGSGSVSDFKTHTMARAGETDDLDEIGEDDEYKYGSNGETSESYNIVTYGKLNKISRQAIINDDLGAITDAFARRGEAAARKIGDIAYAVLIANSAMGDNVALFHADHGNLGTGGAISETTVAEMIKLMGVQKDVNGKRRLNISPRFLLAPKALEGVGEIFFNSTMFTGDAKDSTRANPYAGTRFQRVYDPRLDDNSSAIWYMAGPKGKTVKVFFLNGSRTPYLETKQGWSVDGVEFKTRIDAGAKAVDWRGLARNAGG